MIDRFINNHCHSVFRDVLGTFVIFAGVFGSIAIFFSTWQATLKVIGILTAELIAIFVGAPLINP